VASCSCCVWNGGGLATKALSRGASRLCVTCVVWSARGDRDLSPWEVATPMSSPRSGFSGEIVDDLAGDLGKELGRACTRGHGSHRAAAGAEPEPVRGAACRWTNLPGAATRSSSPTPNAMSPASEHVEERFVPRVGMRRRTTAFRPGLMEDLVAARLRARRQDGGLFAEGRVMCACRDTGRRAVGGVSASRQGPNDPPEDPRERPRYRRVRLTRVSRDIRRRIPRTPTAEYLDAVPRRVP